MQGTPKIVLRLCEHSGGAVISMGLLAILQRSLNRALFYTFLYARFDRVALELLSLLYTFENSTKCSKVSFD